MRKQHKSFINIQGLRGEKKKKPYVALLSSEIDISGGIVFYKNRILLYSIGLG